mmetsp:Transcript_44668/g.133504  ORF Transcript_44668/g.133504 Transcript_44668/m.133504 type:complete len:239 (+) Transcript_44668:62-778(+)
MPRTATMRARAARLCWARATGAPRMRCWRRMWRHDCSWTAPLASCGHCWRSSCRMRRACRTGTPVVGSFLRFWTLQRHQSVQPSPGTPVVWTANSWKPCCRSCMRHAGSGQPWAAGPSAVAKPLHAMFSCAASLFFQRWRPRFTTVWWVWQGVAALRVALALRRSSACWASAACQRICACRALRRRQRWQQRRCSHSRLPIAIAPCAMVRRAGVSKRVVRMALACLRDHMQVHMKLQV